MNLKQRLEKLENQSGINDLPKITGVALIGVFPHPLGFGHQYTEDDVIGYRSGDLTVMRELGETKDDCLNRCMGLVDWGNEDCAKMVGFCEIYADNRIDINTPEQSS